ncbi:MAG: type II toxin-antitoxin system RelE/ParE family toxin [Solirubrobacterales bacterium]
MAWEIEVTDQFRGWWADLTIEQQAAVSVRVDLLGESGPSLGRPAVERIHASRQHNMKELRSSEGGALRVLFMFDPRRQVILLLGGDKSGRWNEWYQWAVPLADRLYDDYLDELSK